MRINPDQIRLVGGLRSASALVIIVIVLCAVVSMKHAPWIDSFVNFKIHILSK